MRGNPWFALAVRMTTADGVARTGDQLRGVARALVLVGLERGAQTVAELPRAWPVTRAALRAAVADAMAAWLCEPVGHGLGRLRLTPRGRTLLAGMHARRAAA